MEVEILHFWANKERESTLASQRKGALESPTGITYVRIAVRLDNVADKSGDVIPREEGKGIQIRLDDHVALVYAGKAVDR